MVKYNQTYGLLKVSVSDCKFLKVSLVLALLGLAGCSLQTRRLIAEQMDDLYWSRAVNCCDCGK